ncbi:hypothetical protein Poly51_55400 [Rubripirellula tenax]|uniref:Zeta toxin n=1 Tax=Rubripirellula tenax TaxID=2528015 RepID=A0A5C6ECD7_9BACT|nr:bifunctional aminoglycoside phosphotransferase/ATP-binding protein [Rubripirellula tenax]TWU46145.1 hypothetical protein Poly51_55400 [Rubripirellula tenax]
MSTQATESISVEELIDGLSDPDAYPHPVDGGVVVHETHISVVFLAGEFAYKVKKPIKTDFLDYSTRALRKHFCAEELRLDSRYAGQLYIGVVPIVDDDGRLRLDAPGKPIEHAVKMKRFPERALLSERIVDEDFSIREVLQLADTIANFHQQAVACDPQFAAGWPDYLVKNMHQIVRQVEKHVDIETASTLEFLHRWSDEFFSGHLAVFSQRVDDGFIRECHGDLHLGNVVLWNGSFVPFDGIEFNERLRWIDVLSDAAFLAMDFAACGHQDLSRSFINAYLERTGDYDSLILLRWFLVYRSLVRALAASMRSDSSHLTSTQREEAISDARQHVSLAYRFTQKESPRLWITHGVSGSGKTTISEAIVQRNQAFRLRSDIERKRLFGLSPTQRPDTEMQAKMYSETSNQETYDRLLKLAGKILCAGYSVIVDATFLKQSDRNRFRELAMGEGVPFAILACHCDEQSLRDRVAKRAATNTDASDANLKVLEHQLATRQPLSKVERSHIVDAPEITEPTDHA